MREVVSFQVGKGQTLTIHKEADKRGMSMSAFIRHCINSYLGEHLLDAVSEVCKNEFD